MFVICIYVFALSSLAFVRSLIPPNTHCWLEGERESRCVKLSQVHFGPSYCPECHQLNTETIEFCFSSSTEFPSPLSFIIYLYNVSNFIGICSYRLKRCTFVRATVNNVGAAHVIVNTKVKHRATKPLRNLLKLNTFHSSILVQFSVSSILCQLSCDLLSVVQLMRLVCGVVTWAAGQKRPRLSLREDF